MFSSETYDGQHPMIHCPVCGGNYVHMRDPEVHHGHDHYDASGVFGIGVRGDVLVVRFDGECNHSWSLVMGEHKGNMDYDIILHQTDTWCSME